MRKAVLAETLVAEMARRKNDLVDAKRNDGIYVVIVLCTRVADDAIGRRVA
jgi:hypothetical protein